MISRKMGSFQLFFFFSYRNNNSIIFWYGFSRKKTYNCWTIRGNDRLRAWNNTFLMLNKCFLGDLDVTAVSWRFFLNHSKLIRKFIHNLYSALYVIHKKLSNMSFFKQEFAIWILKEEVHNCRRCAASNNKVLGIKYVG